MQSNVVEDFKMRLEQAGVNISIVVFGRGCKRRKDPRGRQDRYIMHCSEIADNVICAIQYCEDIEQFIVWKIQPDLHRNTFSVISDRVPIVKDGSVLSTVKGKEFIWKASEDVYTFSVKGIDRFAEMILKNDIR